MCSFQLQNMDQKMSKFRQEKRQIRTFLFFAVIFSNQATRIILVNKVGFD